MEQAVETNDWNGCDHCDSSRDRYALRIKDSRAPTRTVFHGLKWYPPNAMYRVHAKWVPYSPPKILEIPTILGTVSKLPAPGAAEFTIDGKTVFRLEPVLEEPDSKELFFIMRDTTSKTSTYGAGRFLYTELPDHGLTQPGAVELDFNRLINPPCAFTAYATCPLPPPQNRLLVAIPAGNNATMTDRHRPKPVYYEGRFHEMGLDHSRRNRSCNCIPGVTRTLSHRNSPCSINDRWDCGIVNHSPYAVFAGVPVAIIGIAGYLVLGALAFRNSYRTDARAGADRPRILALSHAHRSARPRRDCIYCVISLGIISLITLLVAERVISKRRSAHPRTLPPLNVFTIEMIKK